MIDTPWDRALQSAFDAHVLMNGVEKTARLPMGSLTFSAESSRKFAGVLLQQAERAGTEMMDARRQIVQAHMLGAWYRLGRPTFHLAPALGHVFAETGAGGLRMHDVVWPYPVFAIRLRPEESPLFNVQRVPRVQNPLSGAETTDEGIAEPVSLILCSHAVRPYLAGGSDLSHEEIVEKMRTGTDTEDVEVFMGCLMSQRWTQLLNQRLPPPDTKAERFVNYDSHRLTRTDADGEETPVDDGMTALRTLRLAKRLVVNTLVWIEKDKEKVQTRFAEQKANRRLRGSPLAYELGRETPLDPTRRERVISQGRGLAEEDAAHQGLWVRAHLQRYHKATGTEWMPKASYRKGATTGDVATRDFAVTGDPEGSTRGKND